jgi:hypothetical protein
MRGKQLRQLAARGDVTGVRALLDGRGQSRTLTTGVGLLSVAAGGAHRMTWCRTKIVYL